MHKYIIVLFVKQVDLKQTSILQVCFQQHCNKLATCKASTLLFKCQMFLLYNTQQIKLHTSFLFPIIEYALNI